MYTVKEVMQFIEENDVKFIRLAFCDMFGVLKNISIMPEGIEEAFTNGISFDASAIRGFEDVKKSDLMLYPDASTITVLPWRPQAGRVVRMYCSVKNPDGTDYSCDSRSILKKAAARASNMGYQCQIGAESEFYLFKTDEKGDVTKIPLDDGGYFDVSPLDKGENIRREICLTLEQMGIMPESSHHEQGPGQNEIDFRFGAPLICADNFITFKSAVKAIAARNGLFASFMPKPFEDKSGSGLHINMSLLKNGSNIFENFTGGESLEAKSFIAGVLERIAEITVFLNPVTNSYDRFGKFEAPAYISWSSENRSQLIRIPFASRLKSRFELRSPDAALNPYTAFALLLHAGLDGIEKKLALPPAVNENLFTADKSVLSKLKRLPSSLKEAVGYARESGFLKSVLPPEFLSKYFAAKQQEFECDECGGELYTNRYFKII